MRLVFINDNSTSTVFSSPGEKAPSIVPSIASESFEAPRRRDRTKLDDDDDKKERIRTFTYAENRI